MTKHMARFLWLCLLAGLCVTLIVSVYAKNGPKQKAHGAGHTCMDLSIAGLPGAVDETFINFTFTAPHKGTYRYLTFGGPYAGSWGVMEVQELVFDNYAGTIGEIQQGSPVVYFLAKVVAGANIVDLDYPGLDCPTCEPYTDIKGWYKVGAYVDGGPGHENDFGIAWASIPPEGDSFVSWYFSWFGLSFDTGEEQAYALFDFYSGGQDWFSYYFRVIAGGVNVKLWE